MTGYVLNADNQTCAGKENIRALSNNSACGLQTFVQI